MCLFLISLPPDIAKNRQKCPPALKTQYNLGLFDFILLTMTQKMLGFTDLCQKVHLKMCSLSAVVSVFSFSPPYREVCFLSTPSGGQAGSSSIQLGSPRRYTFAWTFYMLLKTLWDKVCSSCCAPQFVSGSRDTTIMLLHVFDQSNILCSFCCKTTDRGSVFLLTLCGSGWCKVLQSREQASRDKPPMMGHSTSLPCPGSKQLEMLHRFFFFRHTAPQRPSLCCWALFRQEVSFYQGLPDLELTKLTKEPVCYSSSNKWHWHDLPSTNQWDDSCSGIQQK